MSDLTMKKSGEPFETEQAAKMRKGALEKEGTQTEVVEVEGGFALKEVLVRRKKKGHLGRRNVLPVIDKDPNYHYRIVNDNPNKPGRVKQLMDRDYEIDRNTHEVENGVLKPGSGTTIPVGGGVNGVVMRIRKEWYEEDQKEKQSELDATERRMVEDEQKSGLIPADRL